MAVSNVRGTRFPKLKSVPDDLASYPPEKFQEFFKDYHASVFRELKRLYQDVGSAGGGPVGKWVVVLLTDTSANTWTPPVYPTMLFVTACAGGGAGGGKTLLASARAGGGGGGGQYCIRRPMWINDGTALNYQCGTGGQGSAAGGNGGSGTATYFGNDKASGYDGPGYIYLNGGTGGQSVAASDGGAGGGWIPATGPTTTAATPGHAVRQQIFHWAGASGACGGEAAGAASGTAGEVECVKSQPSVAGGGGGAGSGPGGGCFGPGAAGVVGSGTATNGNDAAFYGAGGSGANGNGNGVVRGGHGAQGAIYVEYWDPNGDTEHGWIYEKLGGTAAADSGNFTPAKGTSTNVVLRLFGVAAGGSAGGRSNATTATPGAGGGGEYCCDLPYHFEGTPVAYSVPGETAKPTAGDNNGNDGSDLTFGSIVTLKGGKGGLRAGIRTGGAGGGRNGGAGGATGGNAGAAAGVTTAPNSNPAGLWTNGGAGGGGGTNTSIAGGAGGPCEGSRSGDGGTSSGGTGPGSAGGAISWMGTGGVGLNYTSGGSSDGNDALAPGAGGGGCVGVNGTARAGGKGGPGCLIVMYYVDYP